MKLLIVFVAALIAVVTASDNIHFHDCASHEITAMTVTGCTSSDKKCRVVKTKDLKITIDFVANQDTKSVKLDMVADLGGVSIPVPGLRTDACAGPLKCPLTKGQKYSFVYTWNLPKEIPSVQVDVMMKLSGSNGVMACAKMPATIVNP